MNKLFVLILVLVLLVPAVLADGDCNLDKYDYIPGESISFICSCDDNTEKNKAGFIVFQNETTILQATAMNSDNCMTSLFGDSFVLAADANYMGNVTFSLNADGSGSPTNWGDATDNTSDNFNVSGAGALDCVIEEVVAVRDAIIGMKNTVEFLVKNGVTGNGLIHAVCQLELYDVVGLPLAVEPYGYTHSDRFSSSSGEVAFEHDFDELFWEIDRTYSFEIHCYCYNESEHSCYDEGTGLNVGFKSCVAQALFSTSSEDYRNKGNILSIILCLIAVIVLYGVVGYFCLRYSGVNEDKTAFWFSIFCFGIAISEFIFMVGILFINELGWNLADLLKMHFYIMLLLSFGVGFAGLILITIRIFKSNDDDKKATKW